MKPESSYRGLLVVLAATAVAVGGGAAVRLAQEQEGVVISAGMNKLVMSDTQGKQHAHAVEEGTKITIHGKPARLEELKLGMRIRATLDENNKLLSVATVDEMKGERAPAAAVRSAEVAYERFVGSPRGTNAWNLHNRF